MWEIRGRRLSPLIDELSIERRVRELAEEIRRDFSNARGEPVIVGILKGAFIFLADLVREMSIPVVVDFLWVSSYGQSMESSGEVRILKDLSVDVRGRWVLLVDDILDTGLTVKEIFEFLRRKEPEVLKTCILLEKKGRKRVDFRPDYLGFEVPNRFLVGYGLDWGELGRNLRGIYAVED